jgi:hypothetical protein
MPTERRAVDSTAGIMCIDRILQIITHLKLEIKVGSKPGKVTFGIAVGMRTDMLPDVLRTLIQAMMTTRYPHSVEDSSKGGGLEVGLNQLVLEAFQIRDGALFKGVMKAKRGSKTCSQYRRVCFEYAKWVELVVVVMYEI